MKITLKNNEVNAIKNEAIPAIIDMTREICPDDVPVDIGIDKIFMSRTFEVGSIECDENNNIVLDIDEDVFIKTMNIISRISKIAKPVLTVVSLFKEVIGTALGKFKTLETELDSWSESRLVYGVYQWNIDGVSGWAVVSRKKDSKNWISVVGTIRPTGPICDMDMPRIDELILKAINTDTENGAGNVTTFNNREDAMEFMKSIH